MKKFTFPKLSIILFIIFGVLKAIQFLLQYLQKQGIYIYFSGFGTRQIIAVIIPLCVMLFIFAVAFLLYKNIPNKRWAFVWAFILTIVMLFVALPSHAFMFAFGYGSPYYEYTSDDKKHEIVVQDNSFLFDGNGSIYEKTSFCTMKRVGGYSTDDGLCPFRNDKQFYFVWNENDFELHHAFFGSEKPHEFKVVKMKYAK